MLANVQKTLLSVWFRVGAALLFIGCISGIFLGCLWQKKSSDLTTQVTPLQDIDSTPVVKCGLYIQDFPTFSINSERFSMNAIVWFEFDEDKVKLDDVDNFIFSNGNIKSRSQPIVRESGSEKFVAYRVNVEFEEELGFHNFPFDAHQIEIILSNPFVTPDDFVLITDDHSFVASPRLAMHNWKIDKFSSSYGKQVSQLHSLDANKKNEYPVVIFTLDISKLGTKESIVLLLPLLFALLLAMLSLLVPQESHFAHSPDGGFMFTLSSAAITSILAYRFVIETMLPKVGYATTIDLVFTLCLVSAFVPFLLEILTNLFMRYYTTHEDHKQQGIASSITLGNVLAFVLLGVIQVVLLGKILLG